MDVQALVPVAPGEPISVVEESVRRLKGLGLEPLYVADRPSEDLIEAVEETGGRVVPRESSRGRRAGALNDGLEVTDSDLVAIMDVDSRPSSAFMEKCVSALKRDAEVFLASGPRRVTNEDGGNVPLMVSAEYRLIGDLYRFVELSGGFLQFNGLIGVVRRTALERGLDEEVSCEDVDLATRAYTDGERVELVEAEVGEQAPPSTGDLYSQRVRWLYGALETLHKHGRGLLTSGAPLSVKVSWLVEMMAPLLLVLLSPLMVLSPLYGLRLLWTGEKRAGSKSVLLPLLGAILVYCSLVALGKFALGRRPRWETAERT